jgi:predicted ArsR family transcriptional regulator
VSHGSNFVGRPNNTLGWANQLAETGFTQFVEINHVTRGRKKKLSPERTLLEMLLNSDDSRGGSTTREIADATDVSKQTVRNRMAELRESGFVVSDDIGSQQLHRMTPDGRDHIANRLRDLVR